MSQPEATMEDLLQSVAQQADYEFRLLAKAIEKRLVWKFPQIMDRANCFMQTLWRFEHDFRLPGDWNRRVNELYNEYEYLRALALQIMGREQAEAGR